MPKVDKSIVGIHNKEAVINTIRDNSPIFRAEIARLTGLSIPTVMKITDEFKESGLIYESGKPKLLSFVPDAKYIIGVDVGTTHVGAVLMDLSARILLREWAPTHDGHTFPQVLEQTIQCIQKILDASSEYAGKILGIGVGVPGLISVETGKIILSPAIGWHEGNFLVPLKERFRLPVVVDHVALVRRRQRPGKFFLHRLRLRHRFLHCHRKTDLVRQHRHQRRVRPHDD